MISKYNIGITGCRGFVGSHLLAYLHSLGNYEIKGYSRKSSNNVYSLYQEGTHDLTDFKGCEALIHCAGIAHSNSISRVTPEQYFQTNYKLTISLLKRCIECGVKLFIYFSSVKVHGYSSDNLIDSDSSYNAPLDDFYSISKILAEIEIRRYCSLHNINFIIIRPALVYGIGVKSNVRTLAKAIKLKVPLPFENIFNQRSFCYIYNICDFIHFLLSNELTHSSSYIISDSESISTTSLCKLLARSLRVEPNLYTLPSYLSSCFDLLPNRYSNLFTSFVASDRDKLSRIGWTPPYSIHDGFNQTFRGSQL